MKLMQIYESIIPSDFEFRVYKRPIELDYATSDVDAIKAEFKEQFSDGIKNRTLQAGSAASKLETLKHTVDNKTKSIMHYDIDIKGASTSRCRAWLLFDIIHKTGIP